MKKRKTLIAIMTITMEDTNDRVDSTRRGNKNKSDGTH